MELRRINLVLVVFALMFAAMANTVSADDFTTWDDATLIAQYMREYQARLYYFSETYTWWPVGPCCCDGGGITAPPYPPNNFYRYCTDPNFAARDPNAVDIVYDIVNKFWCVTYEIYPNFVRPDNDEPNNFWDPNWTPSVIEDYNYTTTKDVLESSYGGPGSVPVYPFLDVNVSNYRETLEAYYVVVKQKFRIHEYACYGWTPADVNCEIGSGGSFINCPLAKAEADQDFNDSNWRDTLCDQYGVMEQTGSGPDVYSARKDARRFKLQNCMPDVDGTAKLFLQIEEEPNGWSNTEHDELKQTEDYQYICDLPTDGNDLWKSEYFANFEPSFTSDCPDPGVAKGWKLGANSPKTLVWPDFDTDPNGWVEDPPPDVNIYKHDEKPVAYAANAGCCPVASEGETVDGNVVPLYQVPLYGSRYVAVELLEPYFTEAATLFIGGWDRSGTALTDTNQVLCFPSASSISIPFNVYAKQMAGDANSVWIKFKVTFWDVDAGTGTTYRAVADVNFEVKPTEGNLCCREEESCTLCSLKAGKAEESASCGADPVHNPMVWILDNNDIEFSPPDYNATESFIIYTPECGFMSGYSAALYGSDVNVTDTSAGVIYVFDCDSGCEFPCKSNCRATMITDLDGKKLVEFEYDEDGKVTKQKDADNPTNYYIEYDYNDITGDLDAVIAWAGDVNRVCEIEYDPNGLAVAASTYSGDCGCGGGDGHIKYVFGSDGLIEQELSYDTEEVIYEYCYDETGRVTEKWLGAKTDGNCVQQKYYTAYGDGQIADILDYIDPNNYRVTREYRNSAGLVTKRIAYEDLNEDPDDPTDPTRCYVENIFYSFDADNLMTGKVVLAMVPLSDTNEPDPNSGARKVYAYDPNYNGRLLTETWFDANDVNFTVVSNTYEYTPDGNNVRIKDSNDARGAVTTYTYAGNDIVPQYRTMPEASDGISGTQQLRYEYVYDGQNRVVLEKALDHKDGDKLLARTEYVYDDYGNLKFRRDYNEEKDCNETTEYRYNGFNDPNRTIQPSGVVTGRSYYGNGKLESEFVLANPSDVNVAEPNLISKTVYYYDGNGRLEKVARAVHSEQFAFNEEPDSWVWTEYEYDLQGNRTKVIEDANGLGLTTINEYNHQGEVTKVTLPNDKWTQTVRDGRSLVVETRVGHGETAAATTTYSYDVHGNLEEQTAPDGVRTKYEYDDFDRVIKVTRGY